MGHFGANLGKMDPIGANLRKLGHFGANLANYAIFELTKHIMPFLT